MYGLNEADLLEIRRAFEKDSLVEALHTMEITLEGLGYKRTARVLQDDEYLYSIVDIPESNASVQLVA